MADQNPSGAVKEMVEALGDGAWLRRPAAWISDLGGGGLRRFSEEFDRILGHPVHPLLTDLPIGFWTSAWVLDIVGGRRAAPAARRLIAWGVLAAIPTVATGLGDASRMGARGRRLAAVHAGCNAAATVVYACSWFVRRDGKRRLGVVTGMGAAGLATVGGFIGGQLAFNAPADAHETVETAEVASEP